MGRISYIPFTLSTTTTTDFVNVTPADDKPVKLRGFLIGQLSEVTEAQEEVVDIRVLRMTATVTTSSGGASGAPQYPDTADSAVGLAATVRVQDTTIATTNGSTHTWYFPWQVRNVPFEFWFPDVPFCPKVKQTEYLLLRLATAPADSITFAGWACVEEE